MAATTSPLAPSATVTARIGDLVLDDTFGIGRILSVDGGEVLFVGVCVHDYTPAHFAQMPRVCGPVAPSIDRSLATRW